MTETVSIGPREPHRRPSRRGWVIAAVVALVAVVTAGAVAIGVAALPRTAYSADDVTRALERTAPTMLAPTAARWDPQRQWWGPEWAAALRLARSQDCRLVLHLISIPGGQQRNGDWFDAVADGWGARDLSADRTHRGAVYRFADADAATALTDRIRSAVTGCQNLIVTDATGMYPERSTVALLPPGPQVFEDDAAAARRPSLLVFTQSGEFRMTYFTVVVGRHLNVVTVDVTAGSPTDPGASVIGFYDALSRV